MRYYESTLGLRINRDEKGDRIYTDDDVKTLELIFELREAGVKTDGIKKLLEKRGILNPDQEALQIIEQQPLLDAFQDSLLSRINERIAQVEEIYLDEIKELKKEMKALGEELAITREANRKQIEERDKILLENIRTMQERQKQEYEQRELMRSLPWWKKILKKE